MSTTVRAALLQTDWSGDQASMIDKHEEAAREAAADGAQVMCFQELFYGPYFCQVQDAEYYSYTEPIPDGPTTKRFQSVAKELGMVLVLPMYEIVQAGQYFNTAAVIDADGTYLGKYRKQHIPQVKGFWEKFYFAPGTGGYPGLRDRRRQGRGLHLLRPALPRRLAHARPARRRDRVQPVGDAPRALGVHLAPGAAGRGRREHVLRGSDQPRRASSRSATTTSTGRATSSTRRGSSSARSATRTSRS